MGKLPVSDKTSNFGVKPHIKKAYYPAQLLSVEPFRDKDKNLKEGKYGHQLIFEFAIYKPNPESGAPIEPMKYIPDLEKPDVVADVIIAKFVYHEYKDRNNQGKYQTAITPNSAITKLLKALGWVFSADDGVDPEEFVGRWVEANIDDYEYKSGDETIKASTIKDINNYEGPEVKDVPEAKKREPAKVEKQVKHAAVGKSEKAESPEIKEKLDSIARLEQLNKDKLLTDDGLKQAKEQLETQIEELRKK